MKKKILITGAAGFIGSNMVDCLLKKGYFVVGLDNLSQGSVKNIAGALKSKKFVFLRKDVRNIKQVKEAAKGASCILHLASYKIPRYGGSLDTLAINSAGVRNVLEAARGVGCRVVFASTSDVYGRSEIFPLTEKSPLVMGETQIRRWSYAVSKMFGEHLCWAYEEKYRLPVVVLRYFGVYGPRQNLSWRGGPQSVFISAVLEGRALEIHGDGKQKRCFTYIDDIVRGTALAIESEKAEGEVFNLGSREEVSIIKLAELIWRLSGKKANPQLKFIPYKSFGGRYEDVMRRLPDVTKAGKILGFRVETKLKNGLARTIDWQKRNSQFYV